MFPTHPLIALIVGLLATLGCSLTPRATDPPSGHVCTEIVGLPNVALSFDGGKTLVQSRTPRAPRDTVYGLVSLGAPYALAALIGHIDGPYELLVSADGGCRWTSRGRPGVTGIAEGRDGVAYAWGDGLYTVSLSGARKLSEGPEGIQAVGVDAVDKNHLKALAAVGVFDSSDGGRTWLKVANFWPLGERPRVVFAPRDIDHILVGEFDSPIRVTRDGGRSWVLSGGPKWDKHLWFEPDGTTVWAFGSSFHRSTDGGTTFSKVGTPVPPSPEGGFVVLLSAQPDPGRLVFAAHDVRSHFILRFDTKSLQWTKQTMPLDPGVWGESIERLHASAGGDGLVSATFVPGEPSALCLGIATSPPSSGFGDRIELPRTITAPPTVP